MLIARKPGFILFLLSIFVAGTSWICLAVPTGQKSGDRLPTADSIVARYVAAIGGKKRLVAIHDSKTEWTIDDLPQSAGKATIELKVPALLRLTITASGNMVEYGAGSASVWDRDSDGTVRTVTGAASADRRLMALLLASRFAGISKLNVMARVTGRQTESGSSSYVVEFSMRNGSVVRAWFDSKSNLLNRLEDRSGKNVVVFGGYTTQQEILEPSEMKWLVADQPARTLKLVRSVHNSELSQAEFDPPAVEQTADIGRLMSDLQANQKQIDERVADYSFTQTETRREIDDKGELKKETVKVYEVFPVPGREPALRLISENGVPLSTERAEKEQRRVGEELEKAQRERAKDKEREKKAAEKGKENNDDRGPDISTFLRASDLISPRLEMLDGRQVEVLDFRPKPGFKPATRSENLVAKLVGTVWIDPVDKVVIRLEARFAEGFKVGGGLVLSIKPGAAFVLAQTRMVDGVWLPGFAQANASYKLFLLGGGDINATFEFSNYRRSSAEAGDYKLNPPASQQKKEKGPDE